VQAAEALARLVLAVYGACTPPAGVTGAAAITPHVRHVLDAALKVRRVPVTRGGARVRQDGFVD
jgi:hypothetical protein